MQRFFIEGGESTRSNAYNYSHARMVRLHDFIVALSKA